MPVHYHLVSPDLHVYAGTWRTYDSATDAANRLGCAIVRVDYEPCPYCEDDE